MKVEQVLHRKLAWKFPCATPTTHLTSACSARADTWRRIRRCHPSMQQQQNQ